MSADLASLPSRDAPSSVLELPVDLARQLYLRARYFGALDGLRGVSILAVIWHHTGGHRGGLLGRGYLGVDLFFAISGLLITSLLLREESRTGTISLRSFYIRRTLRIFPLYYAVVALYTVLVALLDRRTPAGTAFLHNLPAFLTYTSNWFVDLGSGNRVVFYFAWSLATEEQFYLLWPSVVRLARRWWLPVMVMGGLLVAGEGARAAVASGWLDRSDLWVRIVASIASPICLGSLAAYLLHRPGGFRLAYPVLGRRWSAPLAGAALLAAASLPDPPTLLVHVAMTALVVSCAIRPDHGLRRLLERRAIRYVGTVSYGMYLLHMLALNAARRIAPGAGDLLLFLLAASLAISLAAFSHRFFETPIGAFKERLTRGDRSKAPDEGAAQTGIVV